MKSAEFSRHFSSGLKAIPLLFFFAVAQPAREPVLPFEKPGAVPKANKIDELVFSQLDALGIKPTYLCSDEVFIRRAYLDLTGTAPTAAQVRDYLAAPAANRRAQVVNRLLDSEAYIAYQALKWCDVLRVKSEFPVNLWPNAVQAYHRWVSTAIRSNQTYDQFARELLTASGVNFRDPPANFYRAVQKKEAFTLASTAALTFMGSRTSRWPKDRFEGLAGFFSKVAYKSTLEWKEEIVFFDPDKPAPKGANGLPIQAVFPDGKKPAIDPSVDPRLVFTDWLLAPDNPYFSRAGANRLWSWIMGRGIIHEPDDIRPDNPPSNPALMAYLETEFRALGYDMRKFYRLVCASSTYQLSSIPSDPALTNETHFSCYRMRRLEAEVLIDIINQFTGGIESYSSPIPEPFTYIPNGKPSVEIADGSISSAFLEMFGRPSRDSGMESERNNTPSAEQQIHLFNSSHIQDKISRSAGLRKILAQPNVKPERILEDLYLSILSRRPTDDEKTKVGAYFQERKEKNKQGEGLIDLSWALINSTEYIMKH
ncbi:MAG: DUF1553 domain-containing protein [Spirochaetes bacterium]|nr:DUF1553 domain-containing protein [Spirochaetota bacterium]